jgi:hypothetical protein
MYQKMERKIHPVIARINKEAYAYYKEMYDSELNNPHGRHRSIDGVMYVHPDTCRRFDEMQIKYRMQLLEEYIKSLPIDDSQNDCLSGIGIN